MEKTAQKLIEQIQEGIQILPNLDNKQLLTEATNALKALVSLIETVEALNVRCQQRGERMKIMRDAFREIDWDHACRENPVMLNFFDENGEPT